MVLLPVLFSQYSIGTDCILCHLVFCFLNKTYHTNYIIWAQVNVRQSSAVLIFHCDEAEVEVR